MPAAYVAELLGGPCDGLIYGIPEILREIRVPTMRKLAGLELAGGEIEVGVGTAIYRLGYRRFDSGRWVYLYDQDRSET